MCKKKINYTFVLIEKLFILTNAAIVYTFMRPFKNRGCCLLKLVESELELIYFSSLISYQRDQEFK